MTATIKHATLTGAAADPTALVDGPAWDAAHTITGEALTKTDDTNVTLTLGGAPTTAVLNATSVTVGWSGTLAASRGGFGLDASASSGVPLFATGTPTFTGTSGTGNFVRVTSPTLVTPALGTPSSGTLTNCTAFTLTTTGASGAATYSSGTLNIPQYSGGSVGVASVNGQTGALALMIQPQGRITLTSGVAVMATSVAGATTVYYALANGNQVPIYDGTNFVPTTFTELSQATTDATKSPAAVANNSNYDLFVWNDGGTIRCTRGPAWSSSTSRGTGAGTTELQAVNGVYLNKVAITNGPAANRGTYVGTIRSNGTATIDWVLGASGTAGVLGIWNNYNRVQVTTTAYDSTATWTYSSSTVRQARGSAVNQISFVSGLPEESVDASYVIAFNTAAVAASFCQAGLALDSNTAYDKFGVATTPSAAVMGTMIHCRNGYAPQTGYHTLYALEAGDGTNSATFVGGTRQALTLSTFM